MRINKLLAQATGLSRRAADQAIQAGRVTINRQPAALGDNATSEDEVTLDGHSITPAAHVTIMVNKPAGYVCSRHGQGSRTVYELLPPQYHELKPVGRLDKASSGLLLLTNDGDLANRLTHPRYAKDKVYEIVLSQPLTPTHQGLIDGAGVQLEDGQSRFSLARSETGQDRRDWRVTMQEGRNRQIRRTFAALGYQVRTLHRTHFGPYSLKELEPGRYITVLP